jgi:cysteine desulfurase
LIRSYLDNAATTRPDQRVLAVMAEVATHKFGNPSSLHADGRAARRVLEDARERVADVLCALPREIIFTASATEANNLAIEGLAARLPAGRRAILASPLEHPSVREPLARLARRGHPVRWLPATPDGVAEIGRVQELLTEDVGLAVLMLVNNEVGTIQPLPAFGRACHERGVLVHADAVQGLGKVPITVADLAIDSLSLSGHKVHGPKGAAALFLRAETSLEPQIAGGGQERGRRAGTENVAAVAGFAEAVVLAHDEREPRMQRVEALAARLLAGLREAGIDFAVNGVNAPRVPGILSLRFDGLVGETLLMNLDLRGVAVSLGSACSSGAAEPSHVLGAMGLSLADNYASLRVSLSHDNHEDDADRFVGAMAEMAENTS